MRKMIRAVCFLVLTAFFAIEIEGSRACFGQASNQEGRKVLSVEEKAQIKAKIEELTEVVEKNPDSAEAHLNLGNAYWKLGRPGMPLKHYLIAIKLKPNYAEAYYNLGNVYFVQGEYEQAIGAYKKAVQLRPNFADAYNGLGNALIDAKRYVEAAENYKTAMTINPSHSEAVYNLCVANLYSAKYSQAISSCKKAFELTKNPRAVNNLGNAYFRQGKLDDALLSYEKALNLKPDLAEAHFNVAAIKILQGDRQGAIEKQQILQRIDPQKANKLRELINNM